MNTFEKGMESQVVIVNHLSSFEFMFPKRQNCQHFANAVDTTTEKEKRIPIKIVGFLLLRLMDGLSLYFVRKGKWIS